MNIISIVSQGTGRPDFSSDVEKSYGLSQNVGSTISISGRTDVNIADQGNTVGWGSTTLSASWGLRDSFGMAQLANNMFIAGGLNNGVAGNQFSDVWSSSDGINWTQVTSSAGWTARYGLRMVSFNNSLFVTGGLGGASNNIFFSDVWSSFDGKTWSKQTSTAPWGGRQYHQSLVFNNRIWVMGGFRSGSGDTDYNDVWSSPDGINWTLMSSSATSWPSREQFAATVFNNRIWVMGGVRDQTASYLNDVWSSPDGINWTQATSSAGWSPRNTCEAVAFNNRIYLIGGEDANSNDLNDVWSSPDGINWQVENIMAPWLRRDSFGMQLFNNRIWVMGGINVSTRLNDVWVGNKILSKFYSPMQLASSSNVASSGTFASQWIDISPYDTKTVSINSANSAGTLTIQISPTSSTATAYNFYTNNNVTSNNLIPYSFSEAFNLAKIQFVPSSASSISVWIGAKT